MYGVLITILTPWKPQTNQNVSLIWFNFDVLQIQMYIYFIGQLISWNAFIQYIFSDLYEKICYNEFFFGQKCSLTMYRNAPAIIVMRVQKKASSFLNPNCSKKRKVNVSAPVIRTPAQIGTLKEGNSQLEELTYTRKEKR